MATLLKLVTKAEAAKAQHFVHMQENAMAAAVEMDEFKQAKAKAAQRRHMKMMKGMKKRHRQLNRSCGTPACLPRRRKWAPKGGRRCALRLQTAAGAACRFGEGEIPTTPRKARAFVY